MFELPEYTVISRQITKTMRGKTVKSAMLGNSPHKFVWYNVTHEEFTKKMSGRTIGESYCRGRWLFIEILQGHILVLGECGGKILFHDAGKKNPDKYHLLIEFTDGSAFSVKTQMWGAMELYKKGLELNRKYIKDMRTTPVDKSFTYKYFCNLIDECCDTDVKSVKGLLTQNQLIPGLGNSIAQDILFNSRLSPKHPLKDLSTEQKKNLYDSIKNTIKEIISKNGRSDEYDLYGNHGKYIRLMDKNSSGKSCSSCKTTVEKIQYLGGTCYFCPKCQI
jgi:formamidopyrimidine-DNA glycosylase